MRLMPCILLLFSFPLIADEADKKSLKELQEFFNYYQQLHNNSDAYNLLKLITDDEEFFWVEDGQITHQTREGVATAMQQLSSNGAVHMDTRNTRYVLIGENVGHIFTEYTTTIESGNASRFSYSGALTLILQRNPGGWVIVSGHASSRKNR